MIRTEIKRNICSVWFLVGIALMYLLFMIGDSGMVLKDGSSTTVIAAIFEKFRGNWSDDINVTSFLYRMYAAWDSSQYFPVLAPVFCSLPAILRYRDETDSGSKRFVIARGTLKGYYAAKFLGGIISAALVMLVAVEMYDVTLLIFYGWPKLTDTSLWNDYYFITGILPSDEEDISLPLLAATLMKERAYFCLYAAMGSALSFLFTALCRSRYTVFGGIILVCYVHNRIYQVLDDRYLKTLKEWLWTLATAVSPTFLQFAGNGGFYATREWLALIVAALWIIVYYGLAFYAMSRRTDVGER